KMANVNAPSGQAPAMAPPVRIDDQILPRIRWVPCGKSNCYLDLEKSQGNPIYKIAMDLLKNTNFFKAFTASSIIPSIYIQQEALQITPINNNQPFVTPPSSDALINFVNELGYPKLVRNVSNRRHKFHPRPDSLLHLPNEELVLGYLKFSAKGTKREVFEMPIPGRDQDSPAPKPTKPARKPKSTAPPRPSVLTPVTLAQPAPTSAPAKPQEKKRKPTTETANVAKHRRYVAGETGRDQDSPAPKPTKPARKPKSTAPPRPSPPKAKKSKYGVIDKKRYLKSVAASETEDVPVMEPQVAAEDTDLQKALEENKKTTYAAAPRGLLPPVVIREPESGIYQPLPEVPGKGKAKSDIEEESKKVVLGADEGCQSEGQAGPDPGAQAEGQMRSDAGAQDDGQAGSNLMKFLKARLDQTLSDIEEESKKVVLGADEGCQAGPDPGNAGADVHSILSHVVHAGSDCEHMDLDVADVSPQPSTEQLDEGFTTTSYPKVQENLKLTVEEQVLLEEPASSSGTLSSLQHLIKDISFGDLFFSDKPSNTDKNAETKVESMVNVPIQQDLSSISLMTSSIIDLTLTPKSPKVHQQFKATTTDTTITTTTTTLPPPQAQQQSTAEAMMMKRIGELEHIMTNLIQVNKEIEERLDKHGARLYMLEQLDIPQQVSKVISEVVMDAVDWAMQALLRNRFRDFSEANMKEILHQRM
nr:hypothetical protein [Tanacetum cinerariifolium]